VPVSGKTVIYLEIMKQETLQTLLVARTIFEKATELSFVDDKYYASACLLMLQDTLELVFIACLLELEVDQQKSIENFNFDQLIGELKTNGKKVIKSGTIKALNKQRVIIKHYGQIADVSNVKNYHSITKLAIDSLLIDVVRKNFSDIILSEAIKNKEVREFIDKACSLIEEKKYFDALVEIRKAIHIEFEKEYSVYNWRDFTSNQQRTSWDYIRRGGQKANYWTKNKDWIDSNVKDSFDYIQIDHDKIRADLLEWGISTQDFWNLWRLTPNVFYDDDSKSWKVDKNLRYIKGGGTEQNSRYCLDKAISIILKKQQHSSSFKSLGYRPDYLFKVKLKKPTKLFSKADSSSKEKMVLLTDIEYNAESVLSGLNDNQTYIKILHEENDIKLTIDGYIVYEDCDIV
jgi:flagellar biosynthesis regulator FlbT